VDDRFGGILSELERKNRASRSKRETITGSFPSIFISGRDQKNSAGIFTSGSQELVEMFRFCGESIENSTASQRYCLSDFIQFRDALSPTLPASPNLKQSPADVRSPDPAHRAGSAYFRPRMRSGGMYDLFNDSFEPANPRQQRLRRSFSLPGW
jgi:hypothetical protein